MQPWASVPAAFLFLAAETRLGISYHDSTNMYRG